MNLELNSQADSYQSKKLNDTRGDTGQISSKDLAALLDFVFSLSKDISALRDERKSVDIRQLQIEVDSLKTKLLEINFKYQNFTVPEFPQAQHLNLSPKQKPEHDDKIYENVAQLTYMINSVVDELKVLKQARIEPIQKYGTYNSLPLLQKQWNRCQFYKYSQSHQLFIRQIIV